MLSAEAQLCALTGERMERPQVGAPERNFGVSLRV